MLPITRPYCLIILLSALPIGVSAETINLEILVVGDTSTPVEPHVISQTKTQPDGTGEPPLPLNSELNYYSDEFGNLRYAGYAKADVFYESPRKFGASVGLDVFEGNCNGPSAGTSYNNECIVDVSGAVELELIKPHDGVDQIPFTISAADLFVTPGGYADVSFYIDVNQFDQFSHTAALYEVSPGNYTLDDSDWGYSPLTGEFNTDALIGAELMSAAMGYPHIRHGASYISDTYTGFIDISGIEAGDLFVLDYSWSAGVAAEGYSVSAYAKFQDPLGAINLDLSEFYDYDDVPTIAAVPLPGALWAMISGLGLLFAALRRKRPSRHTA